MIGPREVKWGDPDGRGMPETPNVLFIMTDQHRGDAIGADPTCPTDTDGRRLVHTPNLDNFVDNGALFTRAYSPAPTCVPARRCLWTGQTPATNGCPTWVTDEWDFANTLPERLSAAGYQTQLAGKTHSMPTRNHFGFDHMELHGGLSKSEDDYRGWLERQSDGQYDEISHGADRNSWDPRPSHLPEHQHPTNWTTNRALDFLDKQDPTRPFFLTVSYVRPHQPFDPPQVYWDMYIDRDLPTPSIGDWEAELVGDHISDNPNPDAWVADLPPTIIHRARAGYYGSITHIDHQINRLYDALSNRNELSNTIIVFTADHGEMLGDHYYWRKSYAYEGSARVPLLVRFPAGMDYERGQLIDRPVGLEDIMPTILDAVGVDIPETVEGRSLLDLVSDSTREDWREYYHGEHGPTYHEENATQYLVDERMKYIWNPVTGSELLFDLEQDPGETENLVDDSEYAAEYEELSGRLADRLEDRPEGFSDGEQLRTVASDVW